MVRPSRPLICRCSEPVRRNRARVTVVVLTHNRRAEVLRTLDSLTALAEQPPIIVVDNGSTDGTVAAVGTAFPEVSTLRFAENIGAAARNAGIAMAVTPYVALCDDDTCWQPGSLARAGELLDRFPRLAVVTGTVLVGPMRQLDPTSRLMASSPLPSHAGFPGMAILGFLAGASVIRRAAFLEVGGFEPRFFIGGEETLVAWDLAAAGWQMAYAGDVIVRHDPSTVRQATRRAHLLLRNALWATWLRRPLASAARRTAQLIGAAPPTEDRSRAVTEALAGLPWILRRRRIVSSEVDAALRGLEAA